MESDRRGSTILLVHPLRCPGRRGAFSNADTVLNGYNIAYLGFYTVGAAFRAETALRHFVDGKGNPDDLSGLLQDCELHLLYFPTSIDRPQDTSDDTPTPTGPSPKSVSPAQEDSKVQATSSTVTSTNIYAASAEGQWQPAKRDPRHALCFPKDSDRSRPPSVCFHGLSPSMNHVAAAGGPSEFSTPEPTTGDLATGFEQPEKSDVQQASRLSKRRRHSNS